MPSRRPLSEPGPVSEPGPGQPASLDTRKRIRTSVRTESWWAAQSNRSRHGIIVVSLPAEAVRQAKVQEVGAEDGFTKFGSTFDVFIGRVAQAAHICEISIFGAQIERIMVTTPGRNIGRPWLKVGNTVEQISAL